MNNYRKIFNKLISELSDYTFFELKGWLAHHCADITEGFDENMDDEYLGKLREHIDYLEKAYVIQKNILNANVNELPSIFDFDKDETNHIIFESVDATLEHLHGLFIDQDIMTMKVTYKEVDEISKRDMEMLSDFIDNVSVTN